MSVTLLNVLNTVTTLGTDAYVDSNGYLNIQGTPAFKASSIDKMVITPYVAEVAQASTVTVSTVSNSAVYTMSLICSDINSGMITSVPLTVTSDSTASNTEIAAAFAAAINSIPELSVSATSTTTLVVTAKAGFPIFTLTTTDSKLSVSDPYTTLGVVGVGTGTSLIAKYPSTAGYYNAGGFSAASSIVATNTYTEVTVSSVVGNSAVILVKSDATNYSDLLGTYGTLTALNAGYRAILSAPATTTAAVTVTTGAIALAGGAVTFATLGAQSGDYIVIGTDITAITGITGAAAGFGTLTTAASAATFKFAAWRNLPL